MNPDEPKLPAPPLTARAERPRAARLRRSAVQIIAVAAGVLLSGSVAYAFIIAPERREAARERGREEAKAPAGRSEARPAELITGQPASYDRLLDQPPATSATEEPLADAGQPEASAGYRGGYDRPPSRRTPAPTGPSPEDQAVRSGLFFQSPLGAAAVATAPTTAGPRREIDGARPPLALKSDYAAVYGGHALLEPLSPNEVKAGAIIPAALITAVDTRRPGPVLGQVTQNVFDSVTGTILLIPQGTRLIGRVDGESRHGEARAFLVWERLILPNGKSLILGGEPGADAAGALGVPGRPDRRLLQLGGAALLAGAITTLGVIARDDDERGSIFGDVGDAAAIEAVRVGDRLIDRELGVTPSVRVRAGAPVRVMVTRDLILEPYQP